MAEKVLIKYINKIRDTKTSGTKSWWSSSYNQESLLNVIISFDKKDIKKIVSDDYWVGYPTWSTSTDKKFGPAIESTVQNMCRSYPKLFDFISDHANGIWQMYILDNASGSKKAKLSKRYLASKDKRVILRAVKASSASRVKKFVTHTNHSVRSAAIKKIGIENCYKSIILNESSDTYSSWTKREAFRHANLSEFDYKKELLSSLVMIKKAKDSGDWEPYACVITAEDILSKMNKEDILYYMDYISSSDRLSKTVRRRISSEWG